uniref:CAP-Gly domain-containing protein n=1 Tax=Panagrolaimus sp. JU765 TaxID=591449 RepID=A0AC34RFG2_9BILA
MYKSTHDNVSQTSRIVTPDDIGRQVLVNYRGAMNDAVLKFVGSLTGQDGIFAGVELVEPMGKNDGKYLGTKIFDCSPNHGLFLPIERVYFLEQFQTQSSAKRPDRLIKSVHLDLEEPMSISMTSTNTSICVPSDDDMFDSCMTYNVARPQFMLHEIEEPKPLISMDEEDMEMPDASTFQGDPNENEFNTSFVVTDSKIDPSLLPIIGTSSLPPTDLETPVAEFHPMNGNFFVQQTTENSKQEVKTPVKENSAIGKTENNGNVEETTQKKEKKQRISIKEMISAPPKPVDREKPKKISKNQELMNKILQNMKEQKEIPKKPVRAKISDLWNQPPPPPSQKSQPDAMSQKRPALKTLNPATKPATVPKPKSSPLPPKTAVSPVKNEPGDAHAVRFRQNVGPKYGPRPASKADDTKKENSRTSASEGSHKSASRTSVHSSRTSIASGKSAPASKKPQEKETQAKPNPLVPKLVSRCEDFAKKATVIAMVAEHLLSKTDTLELNVAIQENSIVAKDQELDDLKNKLEIMEESYKHQIQSLKDLLEFETTKVRNDAEKDKESAIKSLNSSYNLQILDKDTELGELKRKLKETEEKNLELRTVLNKGQNIQIIALNKEIESLQSMLQIKSDEASANMKYKQQYEVLKEDHIDLEKSYEKLKSQFELEQYSVRANQETTRKLQAELNMRDNIIEDLKKKNLKLEKKLNNSEQKVEELQTSIIASSFTTASLDGSVSETETDDDDSKPKRKSLIATYQETGRMRMSYDPTSHQDVIKTKDGRYIGADQEHLDDDTF